MSVAEEDFEVGRRVGVVARKNRALYETVKQVAKPVSYTHLTLPTN